MVMTEGTKDPLRTIPDEDVGAETASRFSYQASYAAWLSVGSLEEVPQIASVFCEFHEDVLVERTDGFCEAIQVKTQGEDASPLKGTDARVLKSLERFAELEHSFGARFSRYKIASISGFHKHGQSATNLGHCLGQAKELNGGECPRPLSTLVKKIRLKTDLVESTVLDSLRKVELDSTLAKLTDMELRVRRAIEGLSESAGYGVAEVAEASKAVINLAMEAGRATQRTAPSEYFAFLDDSEAERAVDTIEAKRLTPDAVRAVIHKAASTFGTLRSQSGSRVSELPSDLGIAQRKLEIGGFPAHAAAILGDLRTSAETEFLERLHRDGPRRADRDYEHVKLVVEALAEDARGAFSHADEPYGPAMLSQLRASIEARREANPGEFRGLSPEMLTGVAVISTELCRVWWSQPIDLDEAL